MPNPLCKIREPCQHLPQDLGELKRYAREKCDIRKRLGDTADAICAQMRAAGAQFDRENSCVVLPDCMQRGAYTTPELRGVAKYCGVKVAGLKTKAQLCGALHAEALSLGPGSPRVHMLRKDGKRAQPAELDALRQGARAHEEGLPPPSTSS
jgi:hypothetical protein